jgi:AraC family transcriptional regulator
MSPARPSRSFTHGDVRRWRRVGGLTLAESAYAPGLRVPPHAHANTRFVLVLAGTIDETIDGIATTHRRGTLLFRRSGETHAYAIGSGGATALIVDMAPEWVGRAAQHARVLTRSRAFTRGFLLHLAQRLHGEFLMRDEVSRLAIESLALGLLAEASRIAERTAETAAPAWLERSRVLVETHFAERLPLTRVAALVGVHPVHLARTFRRVYRTTFAEYVRQCRIECARRELAGRATLAEIAARAGFADQSHFSRLFKQYTGLTPSEYRLQLS